MNAATIKTHKSSIFVGKFLLSVISHFLLTKGWNVEQPKCDGENSFLSSYNAKRKTAIFLFSHKNGSTSVRWLCCESGATIKEEKKINTYSSLVKYITRIA